MIVNGCSPGHICAVLPAFFGINFDNEIEEIFNSAANLRIAEFWQEIRNGRKGYRPETNLLEEKFKDLTNVDIQNLLRNVNNPDIVCAITGSSAEVALKLLENMSKRVADNLIKTVLFGDGHNHYYNVGVIIAAQNRILEKLAELK